MCMYVDLPTCFLIRTLTEFRKKLNLFNHRQVVTKQLIVVGLYHFKSRQSIIRIGLKYIYTKMQQIALQKSYISLYLETEVRHSSLLPL